MRRLLAVAAFMVAGTLPVFAQAQATPSAAGTAASGTVEQTLMQIEQAFIDAGLKGDTSAAERYLADTYTSTDPFGNVTDKAADIANMKSGAFKAESAQNDEMKVRVYGDAGVVTYRITIRASYKGQDVSGQYRATDVFVKQGDRWQVVASHTSRIGAPPTP